MNRLVTSSILTALLLIGCGGGGGEGSGNSGSSLSGVVADGYLQGATVCLDRNSNLRCDSNEPQTWTNALGAYKLEGLSADDARLYRVLVDVRNGVLDSDNPGIPVEMPYFLTAPVGKHAFISPFSTLITAEMLSRPGLTATDAAGLVAAVLKTSPASLYEDFMDDSGEEKLRRHRIGQGLAREIAYFRKHAMMAAGYADADYPALLPAFALFMGSTNLAEVLDIDYSVGGVNRKYLDAAATANAVRAAGTLTRLGRRNATEVSATDFMSEQQTRYSIADVFPVACGDYSRFLAAPCPAAYPANTVLVTADTRDILNGLVYSSQVRSLWSLSTGSNSAAAMPTFNHLKLGNNGWEFISRNSAPFEVRQIAADHVTQREIGGLGIAELLSELRPIGYRPAAASLIQALNPNTVFPAGAVISIYHGINTEAAYFLEDVDPTNDSFETPILSRSTLDGGSPFTSLAEFMNYYNPVMGNHTLVIDAKFHASGETMVVDSIIDAQFTTAGAIRVRRIFLNTDGSLNHTQALPDGAWRQITVNGVALMQARFPAGVTILDMPMTFTALNDQVMSVSAHEPGQRLDTLLYNDVAINAIRAALN